MDKKSTFRVIITFNPPIRFFSPIQRVTHRAWTNCGRSESLTTKSRGNKMSGWAATTSSGVTSAKSRPW